MRNLLVSFFLLMIVTISEAESFSVYGNSISTYEGYIPSDYRTWFTPSKMKVEETWWYQVGDLMGWNLCDNSSWSGSRVAYDKDWDYNSYFISPYRLNNLSQNGIPDNILVLGGVNDWRWNISKLGTLESNDSTVFCGAYKLMLDRLKQLYPQTNIYCFSILPIRENGNTENTVNSQGWSISEANDIIKQICIIKGVFFISMQECEFSNNVESYTEDGLHPNVEGMRLIADYMVAKLTDIRRNTPTILKSNIIYPENKIFKRFMLNGMESLRLSKTIEIIIDSKGNGKKVISK